MLKPILTDPLVALTIRWVLAAVFAGAVIHKLGAMPVFIETLRTYRLLPARVIAPAAYGLVAAELLVVGGLLFNSDFATKAATGLLCLYAAAMLVNLARGRRDLDCGCGGPAGRQNISVALVLRNFGLAALGGLSLWPAEVARNLTWLDWFTALAASATMVLTWSAAGQLSSLRHRGHAERGM